MHILRTYSHEGWLSRWHLRWRLKLIHWSNSSAVEYSILSIWILCIYLSKNIRMCVCSRGSFLKPNETTDRGLNSNPIPPVWKLFIRDNVYRESKEYPYDCVSQNKSPTKFAYNFLIEDDTIPVKYANRWITQDFDYENYTKGLVKLLECTKVT